MRSDGRLCLLLSPQLCPDAAHVKTGTAGPISLRQSDKLHPVKGKQGVESFQQQTEGFLWCEGGKAGQ